MAAGKVSVEERIVRLERQLAEVQRRLDALERHLTQKAEHPVDRTAVREKVTFDWQS